MKKVDVVKITQEAVAQTMGSDYMSEHGGLKEIESFRLPDIGVDVLNSGTVYQCGIAVAEKNTQHSVHLLTEAIDKKVLSTGATVAEALESPEFLRFALKRIAQESIFI